MPTSNEKLAAAVRTLAQENTRLIYRANITEQLVLRLLSHLASVDQTAAAQIADQVRLHAMQMGNRRDNPIEAPAQEDMLGLLNQVQKAAGRLP